MFGLPCVCSPDVYLGFHVNPLLFWVKVLKDMGVKHTKQSVQDLSKTDCESHGVSTRGGKWKERFLGRGLCGVSCLISGAVTMRVVESVCFSVFPFFFCFSLNRLVSPVALERFGNATSADDPSWTEHVVTCRMAVEMFIALVRVSHWAC